MRIYDYMCIYMTHTTHLFKDDGDDDEYIYCLGLQYTVYEYLFGVNAFLYIWVISYIRKHDVSIVL